MSTRITILLGAWFMIITASAQPGALWEREYDFGDVRTEGRAVAATDDGGFLISGLYETGGWVTDDILLVRINSGGDTLWTRILDLGGAELVEAMVRTTDGNYVICLGIESALVKINGVGDTLWTQSSYEYTEYRHGPFFEGADCMIATEDGGVIVCGIVVRYYAPFPPYGSWVHNTYIYEVNTNGSVEWMQIGGGSAFSAIDRTTEGDYLIAGWNGTQLDITKMDIDGNSLWIQNLPYVLFSPSEVIDVLPLSEGYAVCYALDTTAIYNRMAVDRIDNSGQVLWHQNVDSFYVGTTNCELIKSPNGNIIIAGSINQGVNNSAFGLVAWNESGESQWSQTYDGGRDEPFHDAILASDNSIVLVGYSREYNYPYDCQIFAVRTESFFDAPDNNHTVATAFKLHPCYPNPFNPSTTIQFDLPRASPVSLTVYNLAGQKVETLVNGQMNSGTHTVTFDGSRFSSGVYFYTLTAGSYTATNKMLLLK